MGQASSQPAQLVVWTDIGAEHEADFNAWYDREHMAERVAIPGFAWARRYRARAAGVRRYLAIYRADSLATFTSAAYRAAFARQTDWSNRNFARMTNTQRRVVAVAAEAGVGAGAAIALFELDPDADPAPALAALAGRPAVLRVQALDPDPALSTPLPSETASPRILRRLLLADTTAGTEADALATDPPPALAALARSAQAFDLIWTLDAADMAMGRQKNQPTGETR